MKTSKTGIELIKSFEGFESKPYYCSAGKLTIGYGHVILPKESFTSLTKEEAEILLAKDLEKFESFVKNMVTVELTQHQFDALVSFCFNLGPVNLKKSTLLKKINKKDFEGASKEFSKWVFASGKKLAGLVRRREAEASLFNRNLE